MGGTDATEDDTFFYWLLQTHNETKLATDTPGLIFDPGEKYRSAKSNYFQAPDYPKTEGKWRWVTGEPWLYTNWGEGSPKDTPGDETYVRKNGQHYLRLYAMDAADTSSWSGRPSGAKLTDWYDEPIRGREGNGLTGRSGYLLEYPKKPLNISVNPSSSNVFDGETAVFSVTATGMPPLSYRWKKNNVYIEGARGSSLTILDAKKSDAGSYKVVVSNQSGQVTSSVAQLTINESNTSPSTPRALVLETNNDGYARVVQDVTIPAGRYEFKIICDSNYDQDKHNLPEFYRKNPGSAPDPEKSNWKTKELGKGLFEHKRTLTFDQGMTASIVLSAMSNLPIEFRKISLMNASNEEMLLNTEFANPASAWNAGWKS